MKTGQQLQFHERISGRTQMTRVGFCMFLLLTLVVAVAAQQPLQTPAWDVTLKTNTVADSNLEVVNRCKKNHQFQIQLTNLPFLQFSSSQVNVKGGAKQLVPVKFDTRNLAPGVYQGTVWVICQSCKSEGTCTQDREALQVVLRVTSETPVAGPPNATDANPPNSPPATGQPASNQPATRLEAETERLRQIAEEKAAAATAAQERAKSPEELAAEAEQKARELEAAAKRAADLARPPVPGYGARVNGQQYEAGDIAQLEEMRKKNNDDLAAGRITPEEHQRRARELTAALAREERLANQARLKKEAEEAKAAAEKARADADKARDEADAARKAADKAQKEADEARRKFEDSARKLAEARRKEAEAKTRAEAKAAADKAAAERVRVEGEERRRQAEKDRADRAAEIEYLLNNIEALGLITYKPKTNIPDPLDYVFKILRKLTGQTVGDFLQTVAGEIGGGPIPGNVVNALVELANSIGSFFDIRTKAGKDQAVDKLQDMINPNIQPPRKYTLAEALAKIDKMEALMRELQKKLAAAQAAAGK